MHGGLAQPGTDRDVDVAQEPREPLGEIAARWRRHEIRAQKRLGGADNVK